MVEYLAMETLLFGIENKVKISLRFAILRRRKTFFFLFKSEIFYTFITEIVDFDFSVKLSCKIKVMVILTVNGASTTMLNMYCSK